MKNLILISINFISLFANSQNLVINGDFETNVGCANLNCHIINAPIWNPIGNIAYFNVCSPSITCRVPVNLNALTGYQWPHSVDAYSGFNTYYSGGGNSAREYIWAPLNDTLKKDTEYCVEFYVNLCNNSKFATDAIGAYFSANPVSCPGFTCLLPDTPQVSSILGTAITDTLNWTKISGSFIAKGGEHYIAIVNFLPDNLLTIVLSDSTQPYSTYYYLDDVSVTLCDSSSAIKELSGIQFIKVFPNPAKGLVTISSNKAISEICLLDVSGKLILKQTGGKSIDVTAVADGFYTLICKFEKGDLGYEKIVVQHE